MSRGGGDQRRRVAVRVSKLTGGLERVFTSACVSQLL